MLNASAFTLSVALVVEPSAAICVVYQPANVCPVFVRYDPTALNVYTSPAVASS